MLLLIDAGNTRIKWALVDSALHGSVRLGQWQDCGAVGREDVRQLANAWRGSKIERVMVSNVAGVALRDSLDQALLRALGPKPVPIEWFASVPSCGGVQNGYRDPGQLGCDRFASAIGAQALYPAQTLIVATFGTATTVDAVSADGRFIGGMILPGLGLMATSLARNTAQLPQVGDDLALATPFADNTDQAIVSGCIAAQAGAVERAVAAHGPAPVRCIVSGGAAAMIAPHLGVVCTRIDNLVMIGLQAVATHFHSPC
ncbi:MAG: type III pantothenate kinase [Herminiimonas sp.]|nr:type III pantothenate kinase [Herminiimonas sp.]